VYRRRKLSQLFCLLSEQSVLHQTENKFIACWYCSIYLSVVIFFWHLIGVIVIKLIMCI